ncbi:Transcriptional regulator, AraC family [Streptomyces misionensis JCM 4497]
MRAAAGGRRRVLRAARPLGPGRARRRGHGRRARHRHPGGPARPGGVRRAARRRGGRHAHRVHLHGHLPAGRHRSAGRAAGHHPLGRRRSAGRRPPRDRGGPGRPVRRQRAVPHLGRRGRGPGPVSAHGPPRLRLGRRRRRRPAVRHAAGTRGRSGPVHRARPRARPGRLRPRTAAHLAPGQPRARPRPRGHRRARRDQHPDPDPPLPRADRLHPAPVAAPGPCPPGPAPAGDHRALRGAHRRPGRLRVADRLPRPFQTHHRRQPPHLPPHLQLTRDGRARGTGPGSVLGGVPIARLSCR